MNFLLIKILAAAFLVFFFGNLVSGGHVWSSALKQRPATEPEVEFRVEIGAESVASIPQPPISSVFIETSSEVTDQSARVPDAALATASPDGPGRPEDKEIALAIQEEMLMQIARFRERREVTQ